MSPIHWDDSYNVGQPEVDQQHHEWVRIFNKLEQQLLTGEPWKNSEIQKQTLKEILDFTNLHFTTEEKLMDIMNYAQKVQHARMHKEFSQKVYDQYRLILAGDIILNSELLKLIESWFMHHTATEDKRTFTS
ncbi:bacteriohemerythrin [Desulfosediminicola flagellatus]|uniref:bacteriohemerythrin n=1 Tax=Desulfosediminicola flagellatus TaxID=2569541 RepID=UPI00142ECAE6|nr:bacteriohemerythrin [Desulfosediminicola flagellatus]